MQLLGIAGGAGPGEEGVLACCWVYLILPLVLLLVGYAVYRDDFRFAAVSLLLAGLPYLILQIIVANYQPSDDWEVADERAQGRRFAGYFAWLIAAAGMAVLYACGRRLVRWRCRTALMATDL